MVTSHAEEVATAAFSLIVLLEFCRGQIESFFALTLTKDFVILPCMPLLCLGLRRPNSPFCRCCGIAARFQFAM